MGVTAGLHYRAIKLPEWNTFGVPCLSIFDSLALYECWLFWYQRCFESDPATGFRRLRGNSGQARIVAEVLFCIPSRCWFIAACNSARVGSNSSPDELTTRMHRSRILSSSRRRGISAIVSRLSRPRCQNHSPAFDTVHTVFMLLILVRTRPIYPKLGTYKSGRGRNWRTPQRGKPIFSPNEGKYCQKTLCAAE